MSYIKITQDEFYKLTASLIGLPVCSTWKRYGRTISIELGKLIPLENSQQQIQKGQACIQIGWDWRIEDKSHVIVGSSNSGPKIDSQIKMLEGTNVANIAVVGNIPEIEVSFSNGLILRTMMMSNDDPQWEIMVSKDQSILVEKNNLVVANENIGPDYWIIDIIDSTNQIGQRWGEPEISPVKGNCHLCKWYIRIRGEFLLLEFGVCANSESDLDGKVVYRSSGCPAFVQEET